MTKQVFTAKKNSYGLEFTEVCDSLDELKKEIFDHSHCFDDKPEYSEEELKKIVKKEYEIYMIELHHDEKIEFHEYDGTSWFKIVKKDPDIQSECYEISLEYDEPQIVSYKVKNTCNLTI